MSEKGDGTGGAWKATMLVLVAIVIVLLASITFAEFKGVKVFSNATESVMNQFGTNSTEDVTVEGRMLQFNTEVNDTKMYDVYLSLPPIIVQGILTKLGANADYRAIVQEYYKNREFWISTQLSNQVTPTITGPDANNIERVEIKTILKEEEKKAGTTVPLTPSDSLR